MKRLVFLIAVAGLSVGCTKADPICSPGCAPGYTCKAGTCTIGGASLDGGAPDLSMGNCVPTCGANQFCNGSNHCVSCLTDDNCPVGHVCQSSGTDAHCVVGCKDDARCRGAGGNLAKACCGGLCVDTSSDVGNCGGCGTGCKAMNASSACVASKCTLGTCNTGWDNCNAKPEDGCEANLRTDAANCTKCGMACAFKNGTAGCSNECYLAACNYGYDDCNNDPTDGCEASTIADAANCGACGQTCKSLPNAKVTCANATCALTSCNFGFDDCDKQAANGCETDLSRDNNNCGACKAGCVPGLVCMGGRCTCPMCKIPNASARCINNQCVFDQCNPGWSDCNNNQVDGCEVNTAFDANNCGGCGSVCPPQTPSCGGGQCTTLFTFQGIQQNIPAAMLAGWTQCYKDTYANSNTSVASILAGCPKARMLVACRMAGSNTLVLAAMGQTSDVTFDTAMGNTLHNANGVSWYFSDSYSWGFVQMGDTVSRNSCDTGQTNPDKRMCWHTGARNINSGYRCGATILNGNAQWERLIYTAD